MSDIPLPINAIFLQDSEREIIKAHFRRLKGLQEEAQRESETLDHIFGIIGLRATGALDPKGYGLDVGFRAIIPRSAKSLPEHNPNGKPHKNGVSGGEHNGLATELGTPLISPV